MIKDARSADIDLLLPYQIDLCQVESVENAALLAHIERVGQPLYPTPSG